MKRFFAFITVAFATISLFDACHSAAVKNDAGLYVPDELTATLWAE
jgi:hypothetical protein